MTNSKVYGIGYIVVEEPFQIQTRQVKSNIIELLDCGYDVDDIKLLCNMAGMTKEQKEKLLKDFRQVAVNEHLKYFKRFN
jgi:hypothetical protein